MKAIAGVILAAGSASRFGYPKQLLPLYRKPLLQHAIDAAVASALTEIVIVLGHEAATVRAALHDSDRCRIVLNAAYAAGQSTSLAAGLDAVSESASAALILLGDQPGVRTTTMDAVINRYRRSGAAAIRTVYRGQPGHPVLLDRNIWSQVLAHARPDTGARAFFDAHPEMIVSFPVDDAPPRDIDTSSDYASVAGSNPGLSNGSQPGVKRS